MVHTGVGYLQATVAELKAKLCAVFKVQEVSRADNPAGLTAMHGCLYSVHAPDVYKSICCCIGALAAQAWQLGCCSMDASRFLASNPKLHWCCMYCATLLPGGHSAVGLLQAQQVHEP